ncbi:MAG: DNA-processing protein DprA [Clostridia bacterium]|nr:DNA-processing protein DprA [Clostridia bacterium]
MSDKLYDVWFSAMLINRPDIFNKLIEKYKTSENAFNSFTDEDLLNLPDKQKVNMLRKDLKQAEKIILRCEKEEIAIINQNDDFYPNLLKYTDMPPIVLYAKGDFKKLKLPKVTVIGSRKHNQEGISNARWFSEALSDAGLQIVAGFAEGIEANINKTVLSTVVILPCGINITYPAVHFRLKNSILQSGGLFITEYPFGIRAYKENFIFRNRLLAGISDATVFVQCGAKSGTSHTFNWTALYGRDAYVIPGSINSEFYKGSNRYIKEGGILVTCPEDILIDYFSKYPELLNENLDFNNRQVNLPEVDEKVLESFECEEKVILKALSGKILHIDEIIKETNISVTNVSVCLVNLELLDVIEKCEGNRYKIK